MANYYQLFAWQIKAATHNFFLIFLLILCVYLDIILQALLALIVVQFYVLLLQLIDFLIRTRIDL